MRRVLVLGLALAALALPDTGRSWTWPVDGAVLRGFSLGTDPYAGGQHRGIDVAAADGEPVKAPEAGDVTFAGVVPARGRTVTILTRSGFSVTLSHLGELVARKGQSVVEGGLVGLAGSSGSEDHPEPFVQLGIRDASDPNGYRDPLTFLPARPTAVPGSESVEPVAGDAPATDPTVDGSSAGTSSGTASDPAPGQPPAPTSDSTDPAAPPPEEDEPVLAATAATAASSVEVAPPSSEAQPADAAVGAPSTRHATPAREVGGPVAGADPRRTSALSSLAGRLGAREAHVVDPGSSSHGAPAEGAAAVGDATRRAAREGAPRAVPVSTPVGGRHQAGRRVVVGRPDAVGRDDRVRLSADPVEVPAPSSIRAGRSGLGGIPVLAVSLAVLIVLLTTASAVVRRGRTIDRDGAFLHHTGELLHRGRLRARRRYGDVWSVSSCPLTSKLGLQTYLPASS